MQVREFFYCVANQEKIKNKVIKQVRWSKPKVGWLKLNMDGSFGGEGLHLDVEISSGTVMGFGSGVLQRPWWLVLV